ncbi:MAG: aldo/keto reductase [Phycisphaerales bacterium]|nr:MAG: aldo/keto reductase [Phycisphaerales bacterium]
MPILTERRRFGRTNLHVSPVGFGGAPIGFLETERERTAQTLNTLLDEGMNLIDTAAMYRGSEALIGETIGHRRDDYVLVTKCGTEVPDLAHKAWTPELVAATIDRALRNLKTDYLDVMLLHSCEIETFRKGEALGALVDAKRAGKVRHVGYSGDNEAGAEAAQHPEVEVIQTSLNICDQRNAELVLPVCRAHDVGVMVKRPIANAAWKQPDEQPGMYRDYASEYHRRFGLMGLRLEDFDDDVQEGGWAELALRFTLSSEGVGTAIIGTTNPSNALANLRAAAKGPLSKAALERIHQAFGSAQGGEAWEGRT